MTRAHLNGNPSFPAHKMGGNYVSSLQAAQMIGVSLRTLRYWEANGEMPPRTPPGTYPRLYKRKDIEAFAKRYQLTKALEAAGFIEEEIDRFFAMPLREQRQLIINWKFHPSLWP